MGDRPPCVVRVGVDLAGEDQRPWVRGRRLIVSLLVAAIVLSAIAIVASASTPPDPGVSPTASFRSLRLGQTGLKATTVNPNAITLTLEFIVVYNIYSSLLTYDSSYRPVGDLATRCAVAADEVTWRCNLVRDAIFTDPTNPADTSHAVTADDVVFSYQLLIDNPASVLSGYVTAISSVSKIDTYTVQIVTAEPYAPMFSTLTGVPILPQYLWASIRNPVAQEPRTVVGSGPLYFDSNSDLAGGLIIMHRNPNYYGAAAYCRISRPDEVRILPYSTSGAMVDAFKAGPPDNLDGIFDISAATFSAVPTPGNGMFRWQVPSGFIGEIALNQMTDSLRAALGKTAGGATNNQVLLNETVRKAVAMSIDKEAIVRYAYLGLATLADSVVPAVNPWHRPFTSDELYRFDPAAARTMLNDAGWTYDAAGNLAPDTTPLYQAGGTQGLIFRLYAPDSHPEFAVAVANMSVWLRQAGIQTVDNRYNPVPGYIVLPTNQMNTIWKNSDYDLWYWDWDFATLAEVSLDILYVQTTMAIPSSTTDNWYANSTFDSLYNQSLSATDPAARRQIVYTMQKMVYDYASYIIANYPDKLYGATNRTDLAYGWEGWPDFATYPGDAMDSALPNLFFKLSPHDNPAPVIASFQSIDYVSGSPVTINVVAADPKNEPLNFTWDFGDGTPTVTTTTNSVDHTFASTGSYNVSVRVTDSEWPVCATTTATIEAPSGNLPPVATLDYQFPSGLTHGWVNQSITFRVTVRDPEGEPLSIQWDFGDGATASNASTNTATDQTVVQVHTYSQPGDYTLTVTVTDSQPGAGHVQTKTAAIPIQAQATGGGGGPAGGANPWINYGVPIAIALVAVAAIAAILLRRRKVSKEEEERREEPPPPPPQ